MTTTVKKSKGFSVSAGLVILCCIGVAFCVFTFVFGNPANFQGGLLPDGSVNPDFNRWDSHVHPLTGNLMGTIFKGGFIVPILQGLFLSVLVLCVERFIAITRAQGKGKLVKFVTGIKEALTAGNLQEANELCDKQQGSVGNVVNAALHKYAQMSEATDMSRDQKVLAIQKELEEATALELPTMEQNLPVVATMTTLGTLLGLLGTVIGMIKSFAALAGGGSVDSIALSTGISEALVNTAFGIATGAAAVIGYNYFTTRIDSITYAIDEVGFSVVQTFSTTHK